MNDKAKNSQPAAKTKAKGKAKNMANKPFSPHHIAFISWLFLPGGAIPNAKTDLNGIKQFVGQYATAVNTPIVNGKLEDVFDKLHTFMGDPANAANLMAGRQAFQTLLGSMDNLWDGSASDVTPDLCGQIAALTLP